MENVLDLSGKKYIVTGASSGIGRETCKYLAKLGATVILIARNEVRLKECRAELDGKNHKYYIFDLCQVSEIKDLIKRIVEENGKLDGLVYSAGDSELVPLKNSTYERVMNIMTPNLFGFLEMIRIFSLKKNNTGSGSIVGLSSVAAVDGQMGMGITAYSVSKGGVESLVRAAANEYLAKNIRINCVRPGWVKTELMNRYLEDSGNSDRAIAETANAMEPIEVASVIAFLLSDLSVGINGAVIPIMGKWQG